MNIEDYTNVALVATNNLINILKNIDELNNKSLNLLIKLKELSELLQHYDVNLPH